jgi:hypothetical protein
MKTPETLYDKIVSLLDKLQLCYAAEHGNTEMLFGEWILDRYYPGTVDPRLRSEADQHKVRALVIQRWVHGRLSMDPLTGCNSAPQT